MLSTVDRAAQAELEATLERARALAARDTSALFDDRGDDDSSGYGGGKAGRERAHRPRVLSESDAQKYDRLYGSERAGRPHGAPDGSFADSATTDGLFPYSRDVAFVSREEVRASSSSHAISRPLTPSHTLSRLQTPFDTVPLLSHLLSPHPLPPPSPTLSPTLSPRLTPPRAPFQASERLIDEVAQAMDAVHALASRTELHPSQVRNHPEISSHLVRSPPWESFSHLRCIHRHASLAGSHHLHGWHADGACAHATPRTGDRSCAARHTDG